MAAVRTTTRQAAFDPQPLQAMFGDTPAVIGAVLATFCASMADQMLQLQAARAASDAARLQALAHRIKGAAHMSGARRLAFVAEQLEQSTLRNHGAAGVDAAAAALERQWAVLQDDATFRAARGGGPDS